MVPILNPNYDYEKLIKEMEANGKVKDHVDEDSVHMEGQTVCEDYEKQLMDAIIHEAEDDLVPQQKVERQLIDKFGNPIDENKFKNGMQIANRKPFYEKIKKEVEENLVEDDEQSRKWRKLREY